MGQNEFIIRNRVYTKEQIVNLTFEQWAIERISNMPQRLFKYYRNIVDEETKRNYSLEALENNTVYLQSPDKFDDIYDCSIVFDEHEFSFARLKYYAKLCGFDIEEKDYWKYMYLLSVNIYKAVAKFQSQGMRLEDALKTVFHVCEDGSSIDMTHTMFALKMCIALHENSNRKEAWQVAFANALNLEVNHIRKTLSENFRVSCFSTSPYLNRMWASQYANNHKGFCIEYEVPEYTKENAQLFHNLFPVIYTDVRTSVLPECLKYMEDKEDERLIEKIYKYGVLTKSADWKDQDEWRLVSMGNLLAENYNCQFFKIRKVYLGNRMQKEERQRVIEICKRKGIKYTGIIHKQDTYGLADCPGVCDQCGRMK
jgi:hypothetical protein